ncbi:MAG: polysaccharide deacetylase family protein [Bacteroidales bacterium]|jgi:peptidoglycan/xylan/chitin deacetylase (PgdA/CDA1 family)|nr:polysaccharide deacetylase family protein [Bacteroidales bacterium]
MFIWKLLFIRCPYIYRQAYKRIKSNDKKLFLSFDDGPTSEITDLILNILEKNNSKATFFCHGKNADYFPEIIEKIKKSGHQIGNHGYSHKNAHKTKKKLWVEDALKKSIVSESEYFRPPYGKIFPSQFKKLSKKYKIVFWDVLTYDFDKNLSVENIKQILKIKVRNGSIIVFHDSEKAKDRMLPALEFTIQYFSNLGYEFCSL